MNLFFILMFAFVAAALYVVYKRHARPAQTRIDRKLAKLSEPQPVVTVAHGSPRMTGRPRMMDVKEAVADSPRTTVQGVNTILTRRGFNRSSERLVRALIRRLVKRNLLRRIQLYPGAASHHQVYGYVWAHRSAAR